LRVSYIAMAPTLEIKFRHLKR